MSTIKFDCRWTSEVDDQFVKDWTYVVRSVFGGFSDGFIKRKYFENIYGPSVMVVAYMDNQPVGADALWRNDVNCQEAYQSDDTAVIENARKKGVMTGFTKVELSKIPSGSYIYGSPNGQSYWGYKKMGWNEIAMYSAIYSGPKRYAEEYPQKMSKEYAQWWIVGTDKYYIKRFGHYYLVSTGGCRSFYVLLIAEVDADTALMYPRFRKLALLIYRSYKKTWLWRLRRKESMHHISWQDDPGVFPYWKLDGYGEES
jgi:hypothetical protein